MAQKTTFAVVVSCILIGCQTVDRHANVPQAGPIRSQPADWLTQMRDERRIPASLLEDAGVRPVFEHREYACGSSRASIRNLVREAQGKMREVQGKMREAQGKPDELHRLRLTDELQQLEEAIGIEEAIGKDNGRLVYTVDFREIDRVQTVILGHRQLAVCSHTPVYADPGNHGRVAHGKVPRLAIESVRSCAGKGSVSIWQDGQLLLMSAGVDPWILADMGSPYGLYFFQFHDCAGAGGPIEVNIATCSSKMSPKQIPGLWGRWRGLTGLVWIDTACTGATFSMQPKFHSDVPHPTFLVSSRQDGKSRDAGRVVPEECSPGNYVYFYRAD